MYKVPCILNRNTIFYCRDSNNLHCSRQYSVFVKLESHHTSRCGIASRTEKAFFFLCPCKKALCASHRRFERKRNALRFSHSYCMGMKFFLTGSSRLHVTECGDSLIRPSCVKIRFLSPCIICAEVCRWHKGRFNGRSLVYITCYCFITCFSM